MRGTPAARSPAAKRRPRAVEKARNRWLSLVIPRLAGAFLAGGAYGAAVGGGSLDCQAGIASGSAFACQPGRASAGEGRRENEEAARAGEEVGQAGDADREKCEEIGGCPY